MEMKRATKIFATVEFLLDEAATKNKLELSSLEADRHTFRQRKGEGQVFEFLDPKDYIICHRELNSQDPEWNKRTNGRGFLSHFLDRKVICEKNKYRMLCSIRIPKGETKIIIEIYGRDKLELITKIASEMDGSLNPAIKNIEIVLEDYSASYMRCPWHFSC